MFDVRFSWQICLFVCCLGLFVGFDFAVRWPMVTDDDDENFEFVGFVGSGD